MRYDLRGTYLWMRSTQFEAFWRRWHTIGTQYGARRFVDRGRSARVLIDRFVRVESWLNSLGKRRGTARRSFRRRDRRTIQRRSSLCRSFLDIESMFEVVATKAEHRCQLGGTLRSLGTSFSVLQRLDQNTNLAASCMIRGASATVIWPNCELFRAVTDVPPSSPPTQPMQERKLFVRLKASPRISKVWPSRTRKPRERAISISQVFGPGTLERPRFPKVPGWMQFALPTVLQKENAAGFSHAWHGAALPQTDWGSVASGLGSSRFGRSPAKPFRA